MTLSKVELVKKRSILSFIVCKNCHVQVNCCSSLTSQYNGNVEATLKTTKSKRELIRMVTSRWTDSIIPPSFVLSPCRCGSRGNCLEYDNTKLIYVTAAVAVISKFFTTLFFVLAWKFLKPPPAVTVEVNGNGEINYRQPNDTSDTTLIRSENV